MGQDAGKIDFEWIRWQMILAVAAADDLGDRLVLKGGNALIGQPLASKVARG